MTLVRERRKLESLRLSLPPLIPVTEFLHRTPSPSPLSSTSSISPGIDNLSDLEKLEILGHGTSGTVHKVRHQKTAANYALKVIRFRHAAAMDTVQRQAALEAEILKLVDSEYIVKCHGVFYGGFADTDCQGDLCFVMELMEAGSLQDLLRKYHRLSEKIISGMARRVLKGLQYLHGMQIVHRDIKPSNLLINNKKEIKIADFGVSQLVLGPRVDPQECNSYAGTVAYMSPERFDPERWKGDCSDGFAGDVWSLGVVVLECYVGHFPWISPGQKLDWATLMCSICFGEKMEVPKMASLEFQSFVWRCLEKDWRRRGTVEELLNHPFVTQYNGASSR